jgi:hypothetical protein
MRRKTYTFTPVIMIAEQNRTNADRAAIAHVHHLHDIVMSTMNTERSRKLTIGISEIGEPCSKCVARKLSLAYPKRNEGGAGWRAQMGTMSHDYFERFFLEKFDWMFEWYEIDDPARPGKYLWKYRTRDDIEPTPEQPIYYLERKLEVWKYQHDSGSPEYSLDLNGSCDLFSRVWTPEGEIGVVTDWKFPGATVLAEVGKGKIKPAYKVQMNTYGLGYELAGLKVDYVDLHSIPRDGDLDEARPVLMRYDRQVAVDALARIKSMIDGAAVVGWPAFIEMMPKAPGCWDCGHFESVDEADFITAITA